MFTLKSQLNALFDQFYKMFLGAVWSDEIVKLSNIDAMPNLAVKDDFIELSFKNNFKIFSRCSN